MSGVKLSPSSHRIQTCQSTSMPDELPSTPIVGGCAPHVFSICKRVRTMRRRGLNSRPEMIADVCDPCRYGAVIHSKRFARNRIRWVWGRTDGGAFDGETKQQWIKALMPHERGLLSTNDKREIFYNIFCRFHLSPSLHHFIFPAKQSRS